MRIRGLRHLPQSQIQSFCEQHIEQADLVTADNIAMAATQAELDAAYLRWEALEGS